MGAMGDEWRPINVKLFSENVTDYIYNSFLSKRRDTFDKFAITMSKKTRPSSPTAPLTLKERITALRNLPRFFRLVWQTSPGIMLAGFLLRIARSAIPVSILYIGKLIIDQVVLLL